MTDLNDLEYDLALTDPAARPARFRALAAEHPEHAHDLAEWLVELALDDLTPKPDIEPCVAWDDPAVLRAMERFRTLLARHR